MAGNPADVVEWTSRISAAGKSSNWQLALNLRSKMNDCKVLPNEITFGACMGACSKASKWQSTLQLLPELLSARLQANVIIYNTAIAACEKGSQWAFALQMFSGLSEGQADLITYNSLISALGRASHWSQALWLLEKATLEAELLPDRITLNAAISACSKASRWEPALVLLESMVLRGPRPAIADFNAAMGAMDQAGQWERAEQLLSDAVAVSLRADIVTYTSLMSALGCGKQWEAALGLLFSTVHQSLRPQIQTYNAALSALRRVHAWRTSLHLAAGMSAAGLRVDIITQNELIRATALVHQWQLAIHLCRSVGETSCAPTRVTFNAALQGCESGAGVELGLQLLNDMRYLRISPQPVDFSPVILGFVAAGRMDEALQMLETMLEDVCGKGLLELAEDFDARTVMRPWRLRVLPALAVCLPPLLLACETCEVVEGDGGIDMPTELALLKLLGLGVDYESNQGLAEAEMDQDYKSLLQLLYSLAPVNLAGRLAARGRDREASEVLWDMLGPPPKELLSRRAALVLQAGLRKRPLVYLPTLPPLSATELALPPKRPHARELCLLRYVLMKAEPSPSSVCKAVEVYSTEVLGSEGMWSKFTGGRKADCLVAAAAGSAANSPVLEIGTFCGYATLRLAETLPDALITSLETDPTMVAIARSFVALAGVARRVDIRTGHSKSLLPNLSGTSFGMVLMDVWGTQYMEIFRELKLLGLLRPGASLVADNILETGAMLYLWQVANPEADCDTQVLTVSEFTSTGRWSGVAEDWISVSVFGRAQRDVPEPPAQVLEAHAASERMREMAFSPGHSVTARERSAFRAKMISLISDALPSMEPQKGPS